MTMAVMSSINLCPINFREFNIINGKLRNIEASLLYSKLKFHQTNSTIKKNGKIWIIRSREQIASWFCFSLKKVDRLLSFLDKEKMIEKKSGLWYGKRRLYITTSTDFNKIPVNLKIRKCSVSTHL